MQIPPHSNLLHAYSQNSGGNWENNPPPSFFHSSAQTFDSFFLSLILEVWSSGNSIDPSPAEPLSLLTLSLNRTLSLTSHLQLTLPQAFGKLPSSFPFSFINSLYLFPFYAFHLHFYSFIACLSLSLSLFFLLTVSVLIFYFISLFLNFAIIAVFSLFHGSQWSSSHTWFIRD